MSELREFAYRIDPVLWVRNVLGVEPAPWQSEFLRAPLGASIIALTARQVGKTTAAAWAIAHHMLFTPGGLSVIACPAQRQSGEAVRRVRDILIKVGAEFRTDNVYTARTQKRIAGAGAAGQRRFNSRTNGGWLDRGRRGRPALRRPDRRVGPDAGPLPASALCHAVDGMEPHRPVLDGLGRR